MQLAFTQESPEAQLLPHRPQCDASIVKSVQSLPQAESADAHPHKPELQICVSEQTIPQPPQLLLSSNVSAHEPLQSISPSEQALLVVHPCTNQQPNSVAQIRKLIGAPKLGVHIDGE